MAENQVLSASAGYPYTSLAIDRSLLLTIEQHLHSQGCRYGLGAKAPSLSCDTTAIQAIDCSGFVRYALYRTSGVDIGDGSVQQHDTVAASGYKSSTVADAHNQDGAVRIAFLSPADGGGIGHVMLILDGATVESHGGIGPDRRTWDTNAHPFMAKCAVYVLAPPP
jgi:hypothetical protein